MLEITLNIKSLLVCSKSWHLPTEVGNIGKTNLSYVGKFSPAQYYIDYTVDFLLLKVGDIGVWQPAMLVFANLRW